MSQAHRQNIQILTIVVISHY